MQQSEHDLKGDVSHDPERLQRYLDDLAQSCADLGLSHAARIVRHAATHKVTSYVAGKGFGLAPLPAAEPSQIVGYVVQVDRGHEWETRRNARDGSYLWDYREAMAESAELAANGYFSRVCPAQVGEPI